MDCMTYTCSTSKMSSYMYTLGDRESHLYINQWVLAFCCLYIKYVHSDLKEDVYIMSGNKTKIHFVLWLCL